MQVILKDHVPNLGQMSDLVSVSDGYARNFLFPRGLAVPATKRNKSELDHHKNVLASKAAKMASAARALGDRLQDQVVTIRKAVGEGGRLYGSVTTMDIEDALHDKGLTDVQRRQINLDQPIKELGDFDVPVRVHPEVTVNIKVNVIARAEG